MWTRRELLRAVGASATLAALSPFGCGAIARPTSDAAGYDPDRVRDALRAAVDTLGARLAAPFGFATIRRRTRAVIDLDQRGLFVDERAIAMVGGRARDGRWLERGTDDLSPAGVARAAAEVVAVEAAGPALAMVTRRVARDHTAVLHDPRAVGRRTWLNEAEALAARVASRATSRIVYRAVWLIADDDERWIVRADVDERQRAVRGRVGATLVAWQGQRPVAGEATAAGRQVPTAAMLDDDAVARAAADALALYTPGAATTGATVVVLPPELIAALLDRLLAMPALAATVTPAALLALTDEPSAAAAFGGHVVDDDGEPARTRTIAAGGAALAELDTGSARRAGPRWYRTRGPTHLVLAPGSVAAAALESDLGTGLSLDGVRDLRLDPDGRLIVRPARTYEIARSQRTGRVWGDLELRADVGDLLAAVSAVSLDRRPIAVTDDGPARGALMPWLVTRAVIGSAAATDPVRGGGA